MKRVLVLALLLLAGCARRCEIVATDALVAEWVWEREVKGKKEVKP